MRQAKVRIKTNPILISVLIFNCPFLRFLFWLTYDCWGFFDTCSNLFFRDVFDASFGFLSFPTGGGYKCLVGETNRAAMPKLPNALLLPHLQAYQLVRGLLAPHSCFWIIYRNQYFVFLLVWISIAPCKVKLQDINPRWENFKMNKNPTPLPLFYGCFLHV